MENIDSIEKYYVNVFDTKEDLNNKISEMFLQDDVSLDATLSYVKNEKLCYSLSKNVDWFYVEAIENDTIITFNNTWFGNKKDIISYSKNGFVFFPLTNINNGITLNSGDRVYFKSNSYAGKTNYESNDDLSLAFANVSKIFKVGGDIQKSLHINIRNMRECAMLSMFKNTKLTDANNLKLPATTLADCCYLNMFSGCVNLVHAPELPATALAVSCYSNMFEGCTSLKNAPALPATTLSDYCYAYMFNGCTSLETAPVLQATTLADYCYAYMFNGCTSLETAPELPATTLEDYCYAHMFKNCNRLETAPALQATTLEDHCYAYMFSHCTSLETAPELPAQTLAENCYECMFDGCTILETAPELPATTLAVYCYAYMFEGCTSLETAPALPATTLSDYCYAYMFRNCNRLETAPELPAPTLAASCYSYMFKNCNNLKYITCLATNIEYEITDNEYSTSSWVDGVSGSGEFTKSAEASEDFWSTGISGIPTGWNIKTKI